MDCRNVNLLAGESRINTIGVLYSNSALFSYSNDSGDFALSILCLMEVVDVPEKRCR